LLLRRENIQVVEIGGVGKEKDEAGEEEVKEYPSIVVGGCRGYKEDFPRPNRNRLSNGLGDAHE